MQVRAHYTTLSTILSVLTWQSNKLNRQGLGLKSCHLWDTNVEGKYYHTF